MDSTKALNPEAYQAATNAAADTINDLNLEPGQDLPLDPPLKAAITAYLSALSEQGEAAPPAADDRYPSVFYSSDRSQRIKVAQYRDHTTVNFSILMGSGAWIEVDLPPQEAMQFALHTLAKPLVTALASPGIASQAEEGSGNG